ncbi:hypothetical protein [Erwinia aphidicola]|uniref:Uncharacterized protein n=1 Tax=Erwinia aphidicola TaxID=68334 RepID=A0ABU8DM51_ERWAP
MTEQDKQELAGLCRIEIKRWKSCAESNPNMRYMVELMEIAQASLTAVPVAWWTGPEPTPTGEIESVHDHETGSHSIPLICIDRPVIKREE